MYGIFPKLKLSYLWNMRGYPYFFSDSNTPFSWPASPRSFPRKNTFVLVGTTVTKREFLRLFQAVQNICGVAKGGTILNIFTKCYPQFSRSLSKFTNLF